MLRPEFLDLLAQHGDVLPRVAPAVDRALKFADLGVFRLRDLLKRRDARRGFRELPLIFGDALFALRNLLLGLRDRLRSRAGFFPAFRSALFKLRTRGVALLHDHLQPVTISAEFRLHPLHRLREK